MNLIVQIVANLILYGFLLYMAYESLIAEPDPWLALVTCFLLFVAVITTFWPGIRAPHTAPGAYPYDD